MNTEQKWGTDSEVIAGIDTRPTLLPTESVNLLIRRSAEMLGKGLGINAFASDPGESPEVCGLLILVEEGMPRDFRTTISSGFEEIRPIIREVSQKRP